MQFGQLKRREFMTLLGGAAAAWPLAARAQQPERMRRVGVLMTRLADDSQSRLQVAAFQQRLQELGWTNDANIRIEYRWGAGDTGKYRKYAAELVALASDVIVAVGGSSVEAVQEISHSVPIVFLQVTDPVNRGLIASLARPHGNETGFVQFDFAICAKWLELLKQVAPRVSRVAVLRDPSQFSGNGQMAAIQSAAPAFGIELTPIDMREADVIEPGLKAFAQGANQGIIVTATAKADIHRRLIMDLAARYRWPAVYPYRIYVAEGGLISYGPNVIDEFRRAAGYVDRILKGEKPSHLPVQAPTKYELVINLKTAKALGLEVPPSVLARADEVIE
jgi:putative ABC transport system substrate-binding protein